MSARSLVIVALTFLTLARAASAQSAGPSGHWEGAILAPFGDIPIAVDIARHDGQVVATFSRQDGSLTNFPLSEIEASGTELKMTMKATGGGVIRGSIAGNRITGTFAAFAGTVPFEVTRTGDARFAKPVINKAISKTLEGTWTARLAVGADSVAFRMTLTNHPDGTATGTIADENGVDVPITFLQDGPRVTVEIPSARGSFAGTLNGEGATLEGNYVEGTLNAPVIFNKVK
jgi:hypothetical protein